MWGRVSVEFADNETYDTNDDLVNGLEHHQRDQLQISSIFSMCEQIEKFTRSCFFSLIPSTIRSSSSRMYAISFANINSELELCPFPSTNNMCGTNAWTYVNDVDSSYHILHLVSFHGKRETKNELRKKNHHMHESL